MTSSETIIILDVDGRAARPDRDTTVKISK
jgi:hypothetical protein